MYAVNPKGKNKTTVCLEPPACPCLILKTPFLYVSPNPIHSEFLNEGKVPRSSVPNSWQLGLGLELGSEQLLPLKLPAAPVPA